MYNHKQKSNAPLRKNHKTADRKGGVNPYGQPDRKISVFFIDDFPNCHLKIKFHLIPK